MASKPNFLIFMVDQLNGTLFPGGMPADFLKVPHLRQLASHSVRFTRNYTASPLCGPGRASFMSGQLPSRTGVYDNAAEFSSAIPTYAHFLRLAGRQFCPVKCILWALTSYMVLKNVLLPIFIRLILAGHLITANPDSA